MPERSMVAPARRRGLADEVADRVREAIFSGSYAPGTQLREVELSLALDVSRGPVREALIRLEREGLVRTGWHRGATVTSLSPDDIAEIDSLRGALEELAVQSLITRASDEDITAIERAAEKMQRVSDDHDMVSCDIAFHDAVYAAARHRRLQDAWFAIRSQVQLFLLSRIGVDNRGYVQHVRDEHRDLVSALRARDADSALALFAAHRRHAFDIVSGAPLPRS
ncbi:GntR family transcriptional regulator [Mycobacterium sp. Root265]|nr:GntR family transcriptional regulator [Mycobacterium sp. Root265]